MSFIELAIISIFVVTALFNYLKCRDALYPPFINSILWTFIVSFLVFEKKEYIEILPYTYLLLLLGTISFTAGGLISSFSFHPSKKIINKIPLGEKEKVLNAIFLITLISVPLLIYSRYQLSIAGSSDNFYANIRRGLQNDDSGLLKYSSTIALCALSLFILYYKKAYQKKLLIISIAVLINAYLSTGRSYFFLSLCLATGILLITRRVPIAKGIVYSTISILLIYFGISFLLEKGIRYEFSFNENFELFTETLRDYILGATPSLQIAIEQATSPELGSNTFRTVFAIFDKIGITTKVPAGRNDFILMPRPFNVYTVYYPYYMDFREFGIILTQLFFGFIHTQIYKKADSGSGFHILLYGLFMYPLLMQFFHDQYFTLLSLWLQFLLVYIIIFTLPYLSPNHITMKNEKFKNARPLHH